MNREISKSLNKFVIPLLIQYIASYFMGIADTAIVARLSTEAFNAVSLLSSTFSMIAGVLGSITIVLNIHLGKTLATEKKDVFYLEFSTSLLLSIIIGLACLVAVLMYGSNIWQILYGLSGEALYQASSYAEPMSLYILLQLLLFTYGTLFKVKNHTIWILIGSTINSFINLILDYLFVLGKMGLPQMGVAMAAWSNIIGMSLNLILYFCASKVNFKCILNQFVSSFKNMVTHIKESFTLVLQEIIDGSLYTLAVNMIIIRVGNVEYATLTVTNVLIGFLFIFKYLYGSAVLSLISVCDKTNYKNKVLSYPTYASRFSTIIYCLLGALLLYNKTFFSSLVSDNLDVLVMTSQYLAYYILAYIYSSKTYIYQCALQAVGKSKFVLVTTAAINFFVLILMLIFTFPLLVSHFVTL